VNHRRSHQDYEQLLRESLETLSESLRWLKRSCSICVEIGIKEEYLEEEFDAFETFTSRFARTVDIILQKVLRSIDRVELEDQGTLLDVLNRAHKRGLIDSVDEIRLIRELRNDIVHEYTSGKLADLFADVMSNVPKLLDVAERIDRYCREKLIAPPRQTLLLKT